jgi:hypothetical protein
MVARQPELPTGIVTFVLTDIEGSGKIFRRVGDRWPTLLDRHRELLTHAGLAAPRSNGYVALAVYQAARVSSAANGGAGAGNSVRAGQAA